MSYPAETLADMTIIDDYLAELAALGRTTDTLRLRRWQLTTWAARIGPGLEATRHDVVDILSRIPGRSARRGMLSALRRFYGWAILNGYVEHDPTADLSTPRLPRGVPRVAVEAGVSDFWRKYVGLEGAVVGIDRFGESAPGPELFKHFGFTAENVAAAVKSVL